MRKFIGVALTIGLYTACGTALDDVRAGVPSAKGVTVNVPQNGNALIGQTADLYTLTWGATSVINTGVVAVLTLLHDIVEQQPTTTAGNVYTWGPGASSPLDPIVWKLTVTDNGDGTYSYDLDGAPKGTTSFVTVISGKHTPAKLGSANDPDHGSGTFLLDWNARATLPQPDGNIGTAAITYSNLSDNVQVDVNFTGIHNSQGALTNPTYHYLQPSGGDGTFEFSDQGNVDGNTQGILENLTIESRWDQTGAGRADVQVSGGDLGTTTGEESECWGPTFLETYFSNTFAPTLGAESACVFATATYYSGN